MAISSSCWLLKQRLVVGFLFVVVVETGINPLANGCFTSVFSFGDSLTDTGNLLEISLSESKKLPPSAFLPNGRTFFHRPTWRRCDGRLVIDFIAEALGIPFLQASFGAKNRKSVKFEKGLNFAVAGATALNSSFLKGNIGIHDRNTGVSFADELNSFKDLLPYLCSSSSDCKLLLRNSLIVMGEIGGNDYKHAFEQGINMEKIRHLVPLVVDIVSSAINELVELGAVTFLVPGSFPIGCSPDLLTNFQGSNNPSTGCLTWLNQFSQHHNGLLQKELEKLRNHHPDINIVYADYYNTTMRFYHSPKQFGFKETVKACCGSGGPYSYNSSRSCGYPPLKTSCNNPSSYVSWDGIHYTEAANKWLANAVLQELMKTVTCVPH
ncbi:Guard-cell-enriched GDSL Lipase 2 [Hibiscus trionum]|uniref:Guard-cell-enriched GDSL Lipase 2 n=1 Tax=Hibiscus trionum TaxID=183268 RepID=A0A9W7GQ85_HIBTR|nr:Guard-cell-enriched GDSL Lipase 2 [Hibiscus trionum]